MDHQNYQHYQHYQHYQPNKRNAGMEAAAFVLSIISVSTCTCLYTSIVCGALAIIFAILSKGGSNTMSSRACLAVGIGIAGIILTIALYVIVYAYAITQYGSYEGILRAYSEYYGIDYNTLMP